MRDEWLLFAGCFLAIGAISIFALIHANEAEKAGELRYRPRYHNFEIVIRRSDEPRKFEANLMILRAVPWIAFVALAFAALMMGMSV